ncbi:MAG: translation elongation factor EF-1 subunit alpha [Candidatus Undinarchaeales archaeon]|nr:translation elongation factor EF-1 subunit alpha [Candidatus Undinarchaeales archaeon]
MAKPHMNLVFIGHVDHGKSTTVGRILYDSGIVSEQKMKKLKEMAKQVGKETFELAFVMDRLKEERERGLTIDLMHEKFETDKYYYTIIDAPGHRDFIKNMITGASQADCAVLVTDCKDGVMAQTKEHMFLAKTLGIGQMILYVNKMDAVKYDEAKFNAVKEQLSKFLQMVGFKPSEMKFIPGSSLTGENVVKKSENMDWYKGPILVEAINEFVPPDKPTGLPLRLPIQDVFTITGVGTVPVGRVETGVMKPGDKIVVSPSGATGEIKTIEMHHEQLPKAEPGDNVGFNVRGLGKKDIRRGDVIGHDGDPPTVAKMFSARIIVLDHPTVMTKGYTPVFHAHTSQTACKIEEIISKLDPKTGQEVEKNPDYVKTGDAALVKIMPTRPMVIERAKDIPPMGRFAIRDMGRTVAAGMVIDILEK